MSKYDINKFKHVTVALNTPFDKNGDVDLEATKAVVNYFCKRVSSRCMSAAVPAKASF